MLQKGNKVKHTTYRHLTEGTVQSVSKTGKKAVVTWGVEETTKGYSGTTYYTSRLEQTNLEGDNDGTTTEYTHHPTR